MPNSYINCEKKINEIEKFINNILGDSGANGICIGLSGGIDSSLVAYLATGAIGSENVLAIHMKTDTTPIDDTEDARIVANTLGIEYYEIAIDNIANSIENLDIGKNDVNSNNISNNKNRLASGNLKTRVRMSILYYHSNLRNYIVAGTGNKSELSIGYFTKYGDGGCDMLPIGDLYKTDVFAMAEYLNIPSRIITKSPRAGLWENQSDEKEIGMSYGVLDRLLAMLQGSDKNLDKSRMAKELDLTINEIDSILNRISNNKHKVQLTPKPSSYGK